jgi:hypothetical protein
MDEPDDFGGLAKGYIFFRLLFALLGYLFFLVFWIWFVIHEIYKELSLETNYQHRYGTNWQVEYEKYQGSLHDAHVRIAIGIVGMLALVAVITWASYKTFHRHRHLVRRNRI